MLLRRSIHPAVLTRAGLACLVAALLAWQFVKSVKGLPAGLADGVSGFLFGAADVLLLGGFLALCRARRDRPAR